MNVLDKYDEWMDGWMDLGDERNERKRRSKEQRMPHSDY
jgi:hypothetical protein